MFESFLTVPLHFTIEFFGFLVAAGGAILVFFRPDLVPGPPSNRVSVALGLAVLALAQLLHGGAFYPLDGQIEVVAVRTLAYALMLIGVVGALRPGSASLVVGFKIKEPLLFAPAGAALLVAYSAAAAARREAGKVYYRLAAAMLLLAVSELLTAGAPTAEFGTGVVSPFATAAHGIKSLGYLALGSWLWSAVRSSIRTRFVAAFGALLVAVILALSTTLTGVISNNVEGQELDRVQAQAVSATSQLLDDTSLLVGNVDALSDFPEVRRSMTEGGDPSALARSIVDPDNQIFNNVDFVIVDPSDQLPGFAGHGPFVDKRGLAKPTKLRRTDVLEVLGTPVVKDVRDRQEPLSGSPTRLGTSAALIGAARVRAWQRSGRAGLVVFGRFLDALTVEDLSNPFVKASLITGQRVIASELSPGAGKALRIPPSVRPDLQRLGEGSIQQTLGSASFFSGFSILKGGNDAPVVTVAISSRATVVAATREGVTKILFLSAMLVGLIALVLAWFYGRRITKPIQQLTVTAGAVREGDLSAQADISSEDEVGQLGETFNEMTASLLKMTDDLRTAAREEHSLRSRIETIMQSMADGLVAVDADRNVLAFNREAESLTGIPAEEALGQPVTDVLKARDAQGNDVTLPIYELAEGSLTGIFLVRPSADPVPVAVTSAVLRSEEEEISGAVAVLRNMTREREVERMKTEFLSNISHELRTPLTPIKGYAEILGRKEVPSEKTKQFAGGILESTARLERIVELLVDFSALEAGRMAPRQTLVDLGDMLEALASVWRERAPKHQVVVELAEELPEVFGDERLLRRSVEEVIDNAVKFSPQGGKINLEARASVSGNGHGSTPMVEIVIGDEGIGISPDELPNIFSDFHQLDGSETRSYGGLGLGLAFVQRIVEAHKGRVRVESAPDRGTKLTIALPCAEPEAVNN